MEEAYLYIFPQAPVHERERGRGEKKRNRKREARGKSSYLCVFLHIPNCFTWPVQGETALHTQLRPLARQWWEMEVGEGGGIGRRP